MCYIAIMKILKIGLLSLAGLLFWGSLLFAFTSSIEAQDNITLQSVYKAVNKERSENGLDSLKIDSDLEESACLKADDILKNQYWSHNSPTGVEPWKWFKDAEYDFDFAGENLAEGYETTKVLFEEWTNSPSHEANIIGDFEDIGVCIRSGVLNGKQTTLVVNHFGTR